MAQYPALKEDMYFATIQLPHTTVVKLRNTTTQKDFKSTSGAVALLELCTGTKSVTEIVNSLSELSGEPVETVAQDVEKILKILQEKGIIAMSTTPHKGATAKKIKMKYPLERAQIEITNLCNLSCLHCFNDSGKPHPNELTTQEILSVIDTLSSMGVDNITLTGGEPLMHPDLFTIIEHARKAPMSVTIFTNGTMITEEHVEQFKQLKVRGFDISIDSVDEKIHDRFRRQRGALKKTMHAVQLLKEAGFHIKISVSLSQLNKNDIADMLEYFKEQDLKTFGFSPVTYSGRGIDGLAVSPEECYPIWVEQLTYLKNEFPEALSEIHERTEGICGIAWNLIGIKSDGTILPCPGSNKVLGVGNVRDVNLKEFWDTNETLETLRRMNVKNDSICNSCKYVKFCVGCIASAYFMEGELRCYYPYLCASRRAYDEVIGLPK
ncbi:MAG: radical SAM protein [Theionarchaea archaeon]|nr:radical SAM protein [Theionarchaea archaeon]